MIRKNNSGWALLFYFVIFLTLAFDRIFALELDKTIPYFNVLIYLGIAIFPIVLFWPLGAYKFRWRTRPIYCYLPASVLISISFSLLIFSTVHFGIPLWLTAIGWPFLLLWFILACTGDPCPRCDMPMMPWSRTIHTASSGQSYTSPVTASGKYCENCDFRVAESDYDSIRNRLADFREKKRRYMEGSSFVEEISLTELKRQALTIVLAEINKDNKEIDPWALIKQVEELPENEIDLLSKKLEPHVENKCEELRLLRS
ncbi:MAG TPA: hypothetical protein DCS30_12040 [Rhizobiales bacterium]|nr:hypothetical protein [Hyphomicrobiales bacterium]